MKGFLVVTYRDNFQQETTRQYELVEENGGTAGEDLAALRTNGANVLGALEVLTGAQIVNVALNVTDAEYVIGGLSSPETGSNVSDDGVLSVALTDGGKGTLRVPSPLSTKVDSFGEPDISGSADWTAFADLFADSGAALLSDGETVDNTKGTSGILKVWRASRGRRTS